MSSRATKLKHTKHPWLPCRLAKAVCEEQNRAADVTCRLGGEASAEG